MKNKKSTSLRHKKTRREENNNAISKTARSVGFGIISAFISLLLLILVLSAIALMLDDPNKAIFPFAAISLCISSFIGGFTSRRLNSSSALLCGFLTGSALLILYLFLSFALRSPHGTSSLISIICFRASVPAMSVIGAYLGTKRKIKKTHRH